MTERQGGVVVVVVVVGVNAEKRFHNDQSQHIKMLFSSSKSGMCRALVGNMYFRMSHSSRCGKLDCDASYAG